MVTMVSTIANGGTYVKPRVVKATVNSETGERTDIEIVKKDRVISEETAKNVLSMMESVVAEGTGKNSQVKGYRIGGKTGTSEDGVNTGKYVTSFIGVLNTNDPVLTILVVLYNPTGENIMILGLDVLPLYRNQGLARELVSQYTRREQQKQRKSLILTCLQSKVEMYKKMGFSDCGIANSTWGGEEWHEMKLPIV